MAENQTSGTCLFCALKISGSAMTKHLQQCEKRIGPTQQESPSSKETDIYHIKVQGADDDRYWLHLEVSGKATLYALDNFLRATWLECCGHLSCFTIDKERFDSYTEESGEQDMNVAISKVLHPKLKFKHEYDFGSTTTLRLAVIDVRRGCFGKKTVSLLARNDPFGIPCKKCGNPSEKYCQECGYGAEYSYCKTCAKDHGCGGEMLLSIVNSPRAGICGYAG